MSRGERQVSRENKNQLEQKLNKLNIPKIEIMKKQQLESSLIATSMADYTLVFSLFSGLK